MPKQNQRLKPSLGGMIRLSQRLMSWSLKPVIIMGMFFFLALSSVWGVNEGAHIRDIIIRGSQNINPQLVLTQIRLQKGGSFESGVLNEDIRRLYTLGYFDDISVEIEEFGDGVDIIFYVQEKLVVESITFQGNKRLRSKKLAKEITLLEGSVLSQAIVQTDINQLIALYEKKGYHMVDVKAEVESFPERQSAVVTYVVTEGPRVKIRKISFEGNSAMKRKELLKIMKTKVKGIFQSGYLKQEVFQADLDGLVFHYRDHGYINAQILDARMVYTDDKRFMDILVVVEEGKQYHVGDVSVVGNILFPSEDILSHVTMRQGDVYSVVKASESVSKIEDYYSERGYIYATVNLLTNSDDATNDVHVRFRIEENEKTYVENVIIRGNQKTKDVVIRRNLDVTPFEAFNGAKIKKSQEKLLRLEYFEDVRFDIEPGSRPNYENLVVDVVEKKTGNMSFGAGYSTIENLIGFVELTQSNFDIGNFPTFLGGGQSLRLRVEMGSRRRDFELNFVEPWLMDYPVLFGVDLFSRDFFRDDFDERRTGFSTRLGKAFGDHYYVTGRYKLENVSIGDFSNDASEIIRQEDGDTLLSSVTLSVTHNTTDNRSLPSRGHSATWSTELMGLGGDVELLKYSLSGSQYFSVKRWYILELSAQWATVQRYGATDRIPIFERYFAGGTSSIRGFGFRSVGPRDSADNVLGGNSLVVASAEYTFPLYKDAIRGAVFYDTGNVWEDDFDLDIGDLVSSTGLGVRVKTPFGPMKLDYAFVLEEDDRDPDSESGRWHFGVGTLW